MPRFRLLLAPFALLVLLAPADARKQPLVEFQPVFPNAAPNGPGVATPPISDADALKSAGLSATDGSKLIGYLKLRTVSDAEQGKIQTLIKKLGDDLFDDRIKAGEELELFGPAAIGLLKAAEKNHDPEVAYQAGRVLRRMEKIPHSAVASAAVRAVVKLKPPEAAGALLGFLPLADSESLADDIRGALVAIAAPNGTADPAIVAALSDPSPIRRSAAYTALIEGGPKTERIRIKDSYEQVKAAVRKDTDLEAKFRGLWSLLLITHEKEFLPDLIAMIPQLSRGRIWQLEDLLLQLAGKHPEGGRFGKTPESLIKTRDAWAAWWAKQGDSIDLAKLEFKPRIQGFTDMVEADQRGFGMGRVVCFGPDMKEKWQIAGLRSATDARVLPDGKILMVENYNQVNDRDITGAVLKHRNFNQPLSAQPLPNGGMLIVCRQSLLEYDQDGKQIWIYQRPNGQDILAGKRLPGGDTIFLTMAQQGENCFRLDAKGKFVGKGVTVGRMQNIGSIINMDVIDDNTILICEMDKVAEYNLKTGKQVWKYTTNMPTSVQRLPNGNTLIASLNQNRAVEVDPAGEVVWEYRAKDGLQVSKVYRR
ncbi:MAG TPA: PQQ-binding-like beta-propeller repeat protein [Urbifossiella sp.]|jgi:HEAT repeat protein